MRLTYFLTVLLVFNSCLKLPSKTNESSSLYILKCVANGGPAINAHCLVRIEDAEGNEIKPFEYGLSNALSYYYDLKPGKYYFKNASSSRLTYPLRFLNKSFVVDSYDANLIGSFEILLKNGKVVEIKENQDNLNSIREIITDQFESKGLNWNLN